MHIVHLFVVCALIRGTLTDDDQLVSVFAIFRHGERAPLIEIPNDPYTNRSKWPVGKGQLLNRGKRRLFELGEWLRKRYASFLPDTYDEDDIYVTSTECDRTLMSAELCLAGLYPPHDSQIWHHRLHWQPIPVHIANCFPKSQSCPHYTQLRKKWWTQAPYRDARAQMRHLRTFLSDHSGFQFTSMMDLTRFYDAWTLNRDIFAFPLPEWGDAIYEQLAQLSLVELSSWCPNREMARLIIGPFFTELTRVLHRAVELRDENQRWRRLTLFSAHDRILIDILQSLDVFNDILPPYGATVLFELRHNSSEYYVKMLYKNDSNHMYTVKLQQCDEQCPLAAFDEIVHPLSVTIDQWRLECNLTSKEHLNEFIVAACGLLIILLATGCVSFYFCSHRRTQPVGGVQLAYTTYI